MKTMTSLQMKRMINHQVTTTHPRVTTVVTAVVITVAITAAIMAAVIINRKRKIRM